MEMEMDENTLRINPTTTTICHYEDQMVPSITTSLFRGGEEESSSEIGNFREDSRVEVPINQGADGDGQTVRTGNMQPPIDITRALRISDDLPVNSSNSSSSSSRERDGRVVHVWSPSISSFSEMFVGEDTSYLQRRT
ncbi:cryptochrome-1 [Lactuca sativa]|uniref:cryptochrome-1 n=1 Tax=Lactuca sativa TaxID=4236 RepID=UPI000CBFBFE1|nr:cryptochrome-1 [Lactuca sativa]